MNPPLSAAHGRNNDIAWPVMVLAHNEAKRVVACLDSIYEANPGQRFDIFVMANGCTDNTEEVVRQYATTHHGVNVVSIKIADYCNAWNVFIHEIVPKHVSTSEVLFFMDGDCRACPKAFSELADGLTANEEANAAGARPMAGRNKEKDGRKMMEGRSFFANLYALKGRFVREVQAKGVRLPVGLE